MVAKSTGALGHGGQQHVGIAEKREAIRESEGPVSDRGMSAQGPAVSLCKLPCFLPYGR